MITTVAAGSSSMPVTKAAVTEAAALTANAYRGLRLPC
jgi:hypothetical protein